MFSITSPDGVGLNMEYASWILTSLRVGDNIRGFEETK